MAHDLGFWTLQALNALQLSMLLFLLSIGLTVIFGLMHFVNLAHGSLYMIGAFAAAGTAAATMRAQVQIAADDSVNLIRCHAQPIDFGPVIPF